MQSNSFEEINLADINPLLDQVAPVLDEAEDRVSDWLLQFANRTAFLSVEVEQLIASSNAESELPELPQSSREAALAFADELDRLSSEANMVSEESSSRFNKLHDMCSSSTFFQPSSNDGSIDVDGDLPGDAANLLKQSFFGSSSSQALLESDKHQQFASHFSSGIDEVISDLRALRSSAENALAAFSPPEGENDLNVAALSDLCESCPVGIGDEQSPAGKQ